jgi:hypothetical protein
MRGEVQRYMIMAPQRWELLYILDALDLQAPFETEYLVFAGRRDRRVAATIIKEPSSATLLDGFTDAAGRKRSVTALLVRGDAPPEFRRESVLRSLRNVFAVSSVIAGCQEHLNDLHGSGFRVLYSSFFRFYPVQLSRSGSHLLTITAVYRNIDDLARFRGQVSPQLPNTSLVDPRPDPLLHQRLLAMWRAMIASPDESKTAGLFRSLDVAFHAAALPETESIYEMGIRVGLWVSAFEVLAHARSGRANLDNVLDLLAGIAWNDKELRRDCVIARRQHWPLIAGLYADLYTARNDYVHGNPVADERLHTFKDRRLPLLLWIAPLVYKAALHSYLTWLGHPVDETQLLFQQTDWEEALLKALPGSIVEIT